MGNHNPTIATLMSRLRAAWGGRCVWWPCGGAKKLEFAHLPGKPSRLNGRGRGGRDRYYDIRKFPGSYVLLCRVHHALFDMTMLAPHGSHKRH